MRSLTRKPLSFMAVGLLGGAAMLAGACSTDNTTSTGATGTTMSRSSTPGSTMPSSSMAPAADLTKANIGAGCSAVPTSGTGSFSDMAQDPAATAASNNPALSTLVSAVGAAELVDTLNGPGPFTIFAPANSAFEKIPAADLQALLADPKGDLTKILTYHVVSGEKLNAEQLIDEKKAKTVNGAEVTVAMKGDAVTINGTSAVVCGNVQTANATVHIIDTVLMPPTDGAASGGDMEGALAKDNIGDGCSAVPASGDGSFEGMADDPSATAASNNPALSTLVSAVSAAGLVDTLNGPGPFTIFAPANSAFEKIPAADLQALLADPKGDLTKILTYHVVSGEKLNAEQLVDAKTAKTVQGGELTVAMKGDAVTINGTSAVVCGNVQTANGTVHIIDTVLMPS